MKIMTIIPPPPSREVFLPAHNFQECWHEIIYSIYILYTYLYMNWGTTGGPFLSVSNSTHMTWYGLHIENRPHNQKTAFLCGPFVHSSRKVYCIAIYSLNLVWWWITLKHLKLIYIMIPTIIKCIERFKHTIINKSNSISLYQDRWNWK